MDLSDASNAGLEIPINGLTGVVAQFENECISRADIWALAALVGAQRAQNQLSHGLGGTTELRQ